MNIFDWDRIDANHISLVEPSQTPDKCLLCVATGRTGARILITRADVAGAVGAFVCDPCIVDVHNATLAHIART